MPTRKIANLAFTLAHLFGTFALSVSILKGMPLETPSPKQVMFLQLMFVHLLKTFDESTLSTAFGRLSSSNDLILLRDAILIFLKQVRLSPFSVSVDRLVFLL